MKPSACFLLLTIALVSGCEDSSRRYMVVDYRDFGPQSMAYDTFGKGWWQWGNHGDSDPSSEYDIKVVVYRRIPRQEVQSLFPVVKQENKDFRYIEYQEAIDYLEQNAEELAGIHEPWARELGNHLRRLRQEIVRALAN